MLLSYLALAASTLVSEDLTTIGAALLAAEGQLAVGPAAVACAAGIYVGDLLLWIAGRVFGARVLAWPRVAAVVPERHTRAFAIRFDRHTPAVVIGSRFTPGTRLPLYLAAGACRTSFRRFGLWSLIAVALWTPALMAAVMLLGASAARLGASWLPLGSAGLAAAGLLLYATWRLVLALSNARGRQRVVASVSKLWRWEFWPMWLFYAPVAIWTMVLAARYRGYRTITAANPGMPDGGVVGESKYDILRRLPERWTIPSALIESGAPDERCETLLRWTSTRGFSWPVVLKPDVGQRGAGVRLVRGADEAREYLSRVTGRVVAQPFHAGPFEAGVFYYRMPGAWRGRILCVTDKHFPKVVGDGVSTLEDLVWAHPRYRMQARTFLARLGVRSGEIPPPGAVIALGHAGNHAQGTMFTDGRALITTALEARIDEIARAYDGFFIGRFDVRYRDRDAFMSGQDLAIVELNGATAECTNIYDPAGSLLGAWRQLCLQWHLVFAIGHANRRAGHEPSSAPRLAALVREHLAASSPLPVSD